MNPSLSEAFGLPERLRQWVEEAAGEEAAVTNGVELQGGISSAMRLVTLQCGDDTQKMVVRQFSNADWLKEEPDLARHEAGSLVHAVQVSVPTPELIAYDENGDFAGLPSVLMTRLEGAVVLEPEAMGPWLQGLADALAEIHKVGAGDFPWRYFSYNDAAGLGRQEWSSVPELWDEAIRHIREERIPDAPLCFIHRDYHPANVLWQEGRVTGVVDWVNACRGPAGVDVGHCRLNLAMLHGTEAADGFLEAYKQHTGTEFVYDPYWDLRSLVDILFGPPAVYEGWTALGKTGLTDELMVQRLDRYVASVLERL